MALSPDQYAVIGDTAKKGISNIFDRASNKKQLQQQEKGLDAQREYVDTQSETMKADYSGEMQPYTSQGKTSTNYLGEMNTDVVGNDPMKAREDYKFEMGDFKEDPGYKFRLAQGTETIDQSAAGDSLYSGGQQKELMEYGQNLASDEYQKVYDRDFGEFKDMNTQFQDARDYNTDIDTGNINRDVANNQFLAGQGANASGKVADANLDITQDQTQFGTENIAAKYGNKADRIGNRYGFARDQNEIAGDGFVNFMGTMSGKGGFGGGSSGGGVV